MTHPSPPPRDPVELLRRYREVAARAGRARAAGDAGADRLAREALALRAALGAGRARASLWRRALEALRSFPSHVHALRWHVAAAALCFFAAAIFGWLVTAHDPAAAAMLLPDAVYADVLARLADGQHWLDQAEAGGAPALSGSLLVHNLEAAMQALVLGVLGGVGAVAAMIENGVFLGAVAGLVHSRGLDRVLWVFIAPHGVLEFPAVWLAGGAGLALGHAVLLPGPEGRSAALRRAASHVGPVAVGLLPLLGLAALVEGFVSPLPKPDLVAYGTAALLGGGLGAYLATGWRGAAAPASSTDAPLRRQRWMARRR
jgi:uncharacterized membrane protein SpoIIM required for sporulation